MYESEFRGWLGLEDDPRPQVVPYHQGSCLAFLKRYQAAVNQALKDGLPGVRELAPHLFNYIADARTLRLAWDHLALKGGQSPGRNGHRYRDYSSSEVWELCRCLANAIREGTYRPGPERVVWIDKESGNGQRPLVLLNIEDRVVQRAIFSIMQPVLDPLFDAHSFGFRPQLGHLHALALAEYLTLSQRRRVWLTEDVKDAFLHVPGSRLLQVVKKFVPSDDLLDLLERVVPAQKLPGLRQGGPLSPLLLNVYLHHFLDRPWRKHYPSLPLVRVADDLLVLCQSEQQAQKARSTMEELLLPAGMPLKEVKEPTIRNMGAGQTADWLGFVIRKAQRGLAVELADRAWRRLDKLLALAHTKSDSTLRAMMIVKVWLKQRGPCYPWSNHGEVCQKIVKMARKYGFEEVPNTDTLQEGWCTAHARWCKLKKAVKQKHGQLIGGSNPDGLASDYEGHA